MSYINHDNIVFKMMNTKDKIVRLHSDIIPEDLEKSYKEITANNINKKNIGDGAGVCYMIDDKKFYYGAMITHPSMRMRPMISAQLILTRGKLWRANGYYIYTVDDMGTD